MSRVSRHVRVNGLQETVGDERPCGFFSTKENKANRKGKLSSDCVDKAPMSSGHATTPSPVPSRRHLNICGSMSTDNGASSTPSTAPYHPPHSAGMHQGLQGVYVGNLPPVTQLSNQGLREQLLSLFKKFGKPIDISLSGEAQERRALILLQKVYDMDKMLSESNQFMLHSNKMEVRLAETMAVMEAYNAYLSITSAKASSTNMGGLQGAHFGANNSGCDSKGSSFSNASSSNNSLTSGAGADILHMRATRTLYVGSLERRTSENRLRELFGRFGHILDIEVKNFDSPMPFAFIQFADIQSVSRALEVYGVGGLTPNNLGDPTQKPKIKTNWGRPIKTDKLWIGSLPDACTKEHLLSKLRVVFPDTVTEVIFDNRVHEAIVIFTSSDTAHTALSRIKNRQFGLISGKEKEVVHVPVDYCSEKLCEFFGKRVKERKPELAKSQPQQPVTAAGPSKPNQHDFLDPPPDPPHTLKERQVDQRTNAAAASTSADQQRHDGECASCCDETDCVVSSDCRHPPLSEEEKLRRSSQPHQCHSSPCTLYRHGRPRFHSNTSGPSGAPEEVDGGHTSDTSVTSSSSSSSGTSTALSTTASEALSHSASSQLKSPGELSAFGGIVRSDSPLCPPPPVPTHLDSSDHRRMEMVSNMHSSSSHPSSHDHHFTSPHRVRSRWPFSEALKNTIMFPSECRGPLPADPRINRSAHPVPYSLPLPPFASQPSSSSLLAIPNASLATPVTPTASSSRTPIAVVSGSAARVPPVVVKKEPKEHFSHAGAPAAVPSSREDESVGVCASSAAASAAVHAAVSTSVDHEPVANVIETPPAKECKVELDVDICGSNDILQKRFSFSDDEESDFDQTISELQKAGLSPSSSQALAAMLNSTDAMSSPRSSGAGESTSNLMSPRANSPEHDVFAHEIPRAHCNVEKFTSRMDELEAKFKRASEVLHVSKKHRRFNDETLKNGTTPGLIGGRRGSSFEQDLERIRNRTASHSGPQTPAMSSAAAGSAGSHTFQTAGSALSSNSDPPVTPTSVSVVTSRVKGLPSSPPSRSSFSLSGQQTSLSDSSCELIPQPMTPDAYDGKPPFIPPEPSAPPPPLDPEMPVLQEVIGPDPVEKVEPPVKEKEPVLEKNKSPTHEKPKEKEALKPAKLEKLEKLEKLDRPENIEKAEKVEKKVHDKVFHEKVAHEKPVEKERDKPKEKLKEKDKDKDKDKGSEKVNEKLLKIIKDELHQEKLEKAERAERAEKEKHEKRERHEKEKHEKAEKYHDKHEKTEKTEKDRIKDRVKSHDKPHKTLSKSTPELKLSSIDELFSDPIPYKKAKPDRKSSGHTDDGTPRKESSTSTSKAHNPHDHRKDEHKPGKKSSVTQPTAKELHKKEKEKEREKREKEREKERMAQQRLIEQKNAKKQQGGKKMKKKRDSDSSEDEHPTKGRKKKHISSDESSDEDDDEPYQTKFEKELQVLRLEQIAAGSEGLSMYDRVKRRSSAPKTDDAKSKKQTLEFLREQTNKRKREKTVRRVQVDSSDEDDERMISINNDSDTGSSITTSSRKSKKEGKEREKERLKEKKKEREDEKHHLKTSKADKKHHQSDSDDWERTQPDNTRRAVKKSFLVSSSNESDEPEPYMRKKKTSRYSKIDEKEDKKAAKLKYLEKEKTKEKERRMREKEKLKEREKEHSRKRPASVLSNSSQEDRDVIPIKMHKKLKQEDTKDEIKIMKDIKKSKPAASSNLISFSMFPDLERREEQLAAANIAKKKKEKESRLLANRSSDAGEPKKRPHDTSFEKTHKRLKTESSTSPPSQTSSHEPIHLPKSVIIKKEIIEPHEDVPPTPRPKTPIILDSKPSAITVKTEPLEPEAVPTVPEPVSSDSNHTSPSTRPASPHSPVPVPAPLLLPTPAAASPAIPTAISVSSAAPSSDEMEIIEESGTVPMVTVGEGEVVIEQGCISSLPSTTTSAFKKDHENVDSTHEDLEPITGEDEEDEDDDEMEIENLLLSQMEKLQQQDSKASPSSSTTVQNVPEILVQENVQETEDAVQSISNFGTTVNESDDDDSHGLGVTDAVRINLEPIGPESELVVEKKPVVSVPVAPIVSEVKESAAVFEKPAAIENVEAALERNNSHMDEIINDIAHGNSNIDDAVLLQTGKAKYPAVSGPPVGAAPQQPSTLTVESLKPVSVSQPVVFIHESPVNHPATASLSFPQASPVPLVASTPQSSPLPRASPAPQPVAVVASTPAAQKLPSPKLTTSSCSVQAAPTIQITPATFASPSSAAVTPQASPVVRAQLTPASLSLPTVTIQPATLEQIVVQPTTVEFPKHQESVPIQKSVTIQTTPAQLAQPHPVSAVTVQQSPRLSVASHLQQPVKVPQVSPMAYPQAQSVSAQPQSNLPQNVYIKQEPLDTQMSPVLRTPQYGAYVPSAHLQMVTLQQTCSLQANSMQQYMQQSRVEQAPSPTPSIIEIPVVRTNQAAPTNSAADAQRRACELLGLAPDQSVFMKQTDLRQPTPGVGPSPAPMASLQSPQPSVYLQDVLVHRQTPILAPSPQPQAFAQIPSGPPSLSPLIQAQNQMPGTIASLPSSIAGLSSSIPGLQQFQQQFKSSSISQSSMTLPPSFLQNIQNAHLYQKPQPVPTPGSYLSQLQSSNLLSPHLQIPGQTAAALQQLQMQMQMQQSQQVTAVPSSVLPQHLLGKTDQRNFGVNGLEKQQDWASIVSQNILPSMSIFSTTSNVGGLAGPSNSAWSGTSSLASGLSTNPSGSGLSATGLSAADLSIAGLAPPALSAETLYAAGLAATPYPSSSQLSSRFLNSTSISQLTASLPTISGLNSIASSSSSTAQPTYQKPVPIVVPQSKPIVQPYSLQTQAQLEEQIRQLQRQSKEATAVAKPASKPENTALKIMIEKYPYMWQGRLAMKTRDAVVRMQFVSGNKEMFDLCREQLMPPEGTEIRITQRMKINPNQIEGVVRKMVSPTEYLTVLLHPCGRTRQEVHQQTQHMVSAFVKYFQSKDAAGICRDGNSKYPTPSIMVHAFAPGDFANGQLRKFAPEILEFASAIDDKFMYLVFTSSTTA